MRENQKSVPLICTEEEFERFFSLALDMLCIAGFDGYFKQLNPAWEEKLGFSLEELKAKPFIEFIHPEDQEATIAETQKLRRGIDTISFENRFRCKDGSYKWFLWNSTASLEKQLYYAVGRDITDRKRAEEIFQESEKRWPGSAPRWSSAKELEAESGSVFIGDQRAGHFCRRRRSAWCGQTGGFSRRPRCGSG